MLIDPWVIIALTLVIPAATFLLVAAVVSAARMPKREAHAHMVIGAAAIPFDLGCAWLRSQAWLQTPWSTIAERGSGVTGFVVFYAMVIAVVRALRFMSGITSR